MENNETPFEVVGPSALEAISRAEVDISISTARKYPRELSKVKQKMMSFATLDEETAQSCFYSLPRGNKLIQGPSVRLAEIAVSCYQNLRAGSRIISTVTQGDNPHVVVQAVAMDLENNISVSIEKRRRITKKKSKATIDEDDINLAANACSAIAFRDAVFKTVPLALVKPVFEAARKVAIGDARTLSDRRAKSIEAFAKMGIDKTRVLAKLEKKTVEEIDLADIEVLIGLYNAIKEGDVQLDEAFPVANTHAPEQTGPGKPPPPPTAPGAPEIRKDEKTLAKAQEKMPQDAPKPPEATQGPSAASTPQAQPPANAAPPADKPSEKAPEPPKAPETPSAPSADTQAEAAMGLAPEQKAPASGEAPPQEQAATAVPGPFLSPTQYDDDAAKSIQLLAAKSGVSGDVLEKWLRAKKLLKENQKNLMEMSLAKRDALARTWTKQLPEIRTGTGK